MSWVHLPSLSEQLAVWLAQNYSAHVIHVQALATQSTAAVAHTLGLFQPGPLEPRAPTHSSPSSLKTGVLCLTERQLSCLNIRCREWVLFECRCRSWQCKSCLTTATNVAVAKQPPKNKACLLRWVLEEVRQTVFNALSSLAESIERHVCASLVVWERIPPFYSLDCINWHQVVTKASLCPVGAC